MPKNLLDIYVDSTSGNIVIPNFVPKQKIKIVCFELKYSSAPSVKNFIKFHADFFKQNITGVDYEKTDYDYSETPGVIFPHYDVATSVLFCNIEVDLADDIPEIFRYSLSGNTTNFTSLHFVISFDYNEIV